MGKFLPVKSRAIEAFQWKANSETLIWDLISYLRDSGIRFELVSEGQTVAIIIGDYDDEEYRYVRVNHGEWIAFVEDRYVRYASSAEFFADFGALS